MSPISDLSLLLSSMAPALNPGVFVFASVNQGESVDPTLVLASIREPEGLSVVMAEDDASRANLKVLFRCGWITLTVNSDLQAVGLTAAFASALGNAGISCNVVAGAWHDHIFVPIDLAEQAMSELRALQSRSKAAADEARRVV